MTYTAKQIRRALVDAALSEWRRPVDAYADADRITEYFRGIGWDWAIDEHCPDGVYDEEIRRTTDAPLDYCGIGLAWVGVHRLPYFVEPGQCVSVRMCEGVASTVMPSTLRKDKRGDLEFWDEIPQDPPEPVDVDDLRRGDIITVETSRGLDYGDHFALVYEPADTVVTIEWNASGELGDGERGRGVVMRTREYDEIRRVIRLDDEHFETGGHQ